MVGLREGQSLPQTAACRLLYFPGLHQEVFGWVMGKLAEDDELLTVAVADYGRRLNLDRFRELRPDGYIQCGIAEQNLIEVASACANEGFHVFAPCYATFVTARKLVVDALQAP